MGNVLPIDSQVQADLRGAIEYAVQNQCYRQPALRAALRLALTFMDGNTSWPVMRDIDDVLQNLCVITHHVANKTGDHQTRLAYVRQMSERVFHD